MQLPKDAHEFSYRHSVYMQEPRQVILSATFALIPDDPDAIKARMEDFMARRREKQPLEYPSAGSTFRRPEGYFAGKLISDAGLRGYRIGGASVSEKHAGFVINDGNATAADVKALIAHIQKTVEEKFGVQLQREVIYFGD